MSNSSQSGRNPNSGSQAASQPKGGSDQNATSQRSPSETQEKLQRVAKNVAGASKTQPIISLASQLRI